MMRMQLLKKINVSRQMQCNFLFGVIIHAAFLFRFQLYTLSRKLLLVQFNSLYFIVNLPSVCVAVVLVKCAGFVLS